MTSLEEFKQVIGSGDYVILDTETTGLRDAEIIQIAIISSNGEVLLDTLIKPIRPIPQDAIRIHGITNEMVADKLGIMYFYDQIRQLLSGRNVVVFNVAYDKQILYDSLQIANIQEVNWDQESKWFCAMEAFSELKGEWNAKRKSYKWQSLSKACDYYNLPIIDAHNALGDCLLTLQVCKSMIGVNVSNTVNFTNNTQTAEINSMSNNSQQNSTYKFMYDDI
mgnify:FL=1